MCNSLASLQLFWYSAPIFTVWNCLDSKQRSWQSTIFLIFCTYPDSLKLSWQCATVLTVCKCFGTLDLSWQSEIVLTVCNGLDSLQLFWYSAPILTVWNCLNMPGFVQYWLFFIWCHCKGCSAFCSANLMIHNLRKACAGQIVLQMFFLDLLCCMLFASYFVLLIYCWTFDVDKSML